MAGRLRARRQRRGLAPPHAAIADQRIEGDDGVHPSAPHQSAVQPLDREVAGFVHLDRRVVGIARQQVDAAPVALEHLHRHRVIHARDDDLAVAGFRRLSHGDQVAVQDAGIDHRIADDAQQVIRNGFEQRAVDAEVPLDVGLDEDRRTRRDPADQRQAQGLRVRLTGTDQPDPARGARRQFDQALRFQRAQVLGRGVGRGESERVLDLAHARRIAVAREVVADETQDAELGGSGGHGCTSVHLSAAHGLRRGG